MKADLDNLNRDLARQIELCSRCGFCRAVCPVFAATLRPALNARGKLFLLREILAGREEPDRELAGVLYQCTLCGSCTITCPVGVDPAGIILAAREGLTGSGLGPEVLRELAQKVRAFDNPLGLDRSRRAEMIPAEFLDRERPEIIYWTGCLESFQDARIIPAVIKLLDRAGARAAVLQGGGGCCGYPLLLGGDREGFREQARRTAGLLASSKTATVLTTCPGCLRAFSRFYPEEGLDLPRVLHLSQWLAGMIREGRLEFRPEAGPLRAMYHDPCDLGRHLGVFGPPREVLGRLPGLELLEFEASRERAGCCGGGGGLRAVEIGLSRRLAEARALEAWERGAEAIVTACPSCKQSLQEAAVGLKRSGRSGRRLKVMDLAEVAARRLAGERMAAEG